MRSRLRPRDVPAEDDEADADAEDDDSDRAPAPPAVGESGGDEAAVALHWPQNRPGRLSLKLLLLLLLRFGDRRFDGGLDTSMLPISELSLLPVTVSAQAVKPPASWWALWLWSVTVRARIYRRGE
jgi:hypothetical protein